MTNRPESIDDIVRRRLRSRGLGSIAQAAHVCLVADRQAAGRYQAVRYKNGQLVLRATSAAALADLRMGIDALTASIKKELGWSADQALHIRLTLTR